MEKSSITKVLELCKVSPPPNSSPPTTLPLTFFDIPWLFFSPCQPLFFYEYSHSTSHFISSTLPNLKLSLSLALKHFFPFLGNLVVSSNDSNKPKIVYNEGDCVSFSVAESNGDFRCFTSNHGREVHEFYPLVPELATSGGAIPLLAVKVTIFPHMGICIGLAYHHVAADGRTFNNFIKAWSSLCANSCFLINSLPSFDRSVIKDSHGLEEIFLKELWKIKSSQEMIIGTETNVDLSNMVRSTFVVSSLDMERIKKWVIGQCKKKSQPQPIHLSPYVLTCSFIWVCLVKTQTQTSQPENHHYSDDEPNYFGFIAGGLTRFDYPVPTSYFGNCVGFGRSIATRGELKGEDGIIVAANVIGNMIKKLDKEMLFEAERWIWDWKKMFELEVNVMIFGSPKLDFYETDFGWGRPKPMAAPKPPMFFSTITVTLLILFQATPHGVQGLILTLVNNCPFTVYPAIQPNSGHPVLEKGGFPLPTLTHRSFPAPNQHWSGRIWARTDCTHANGKFYCATGDCNHQLECNGLGGASPATLAQFSLHHGHKDFSSYGVSLVDGFNVPMTITPHEGTGVCPVVGCRANLLATCPEKLQLRYPAGHGRVVACKSGCEAFGTDELCCRNHYNSPQTCRASSFSEFFKHACPATFTYAHDSPSLMHECSSPRELKVIFCH